VNGDPHGREAPDDVLVERARSGDEEALNRLVTRHHETAYRVALGILGDPELAADAAQDGFLKAVRALSGFRGDSRFRTWLLTIVSNEARGLRRRAGRRRESGLDDQGAVVDGAQAVDEVVAAREEAGLARRLLARLPEKQRLAVQLRVDEGLSSRKWGRSSDPARVRPG